MVGIESGANPARWDIDEDDDSDDDDIVVYLSFLVYLLASFETKLHDSHFLSLRQPSNLVERRCQIRL